MVVKMCGVCSSAKSNEIYQSEMDKLSPGGVFISSTFTLWKQFTDSNTIVLLLLFFYKIF